MTLRRIFPLLFLTTLCARAEESFVKAVDTIKHSVAPIVCLTVAQDGTAKLDFIEGSGFFISKDGSFVTARHVISEMEPSPLRRPCNTPAVYIPKSGKWSDEGRFVDIKWFAFHLDQCVLSSPVVDLARCRTQDDLSKDKDVITPPEPVTIDAKLPPEGTDIAFSGFPLQITIPRASRATIAGYGSRDNIETTEMVIDRNTWPGASGSPIFLASGHVIGVVLARGTNEAAGLAFARTGNELDKFLKSILEK